MNFDRWSKYSKQRVRSRRLLCRCLRVGRIVLSTLSAKKKVSRYMLLLSLLVMALSTSMIGPALSSQTRPAKDAVVASSPSTLMSLFSNDSQTAANESSVTALVTGQRQYEAGQIFEAMQIWQQAAVSKDLQLAQKALAWSYVSVAAQDLGDWSQAELAIEKSLAMLADSAKTTELARARSQLLNVQGRLNLKMGKPEIAWELWQQAETAYRQANDTLGMVGAQINQAQALQTLGLYRRAQLELTEVAERLEKEDDSAVKAIALQSLGNILQTTGSLEKSQQYLQESLDLYKKVGSQAEIANASFSLANTLRLLQNSDAALEKYQEVASRLPASALRTKASLNRFSLLLETEQWSDARKALPSLVEQIEALPASRESVYSRVNLVESLLVRGDKEHQPLTWFSPDAAARLLSEGAQQAKDLQDIRAESFAIGELSKTYGYAAQWPDSQLLAQRAIDLAQASNAQDISYRWQQQLGKAYHQQSQDEKAIASYTEAVSILDEVRRDLLATNVDAQFSFRETVEPVYRELVSLLLLPEEASQDALMQAREVIEGLQLAELENYFSSACLDAASEYVDKLDPQAATVYPIVLKDRVEVILSLPDSPLKHYRTWQSEDSTNKTLSDLFQYFNPALSRNKRLDLSKQVYDWLITPAEVALREKNIQTLVFVLDGQFRSIPMSALYDGEQYLLENYGVALTPGLKLLGPHFQNPKPLKALMMGLTEARDGFSALPGVREEIEQVSNNVSAEVLFNQDFTKEKLSKELERLSFPVLHLATHGQFSSDLEKTFLLAWDKRININELDDLLRSRRQQDEPIELMVLSACQTAQGDDRATLGLAGMAVRSGARSTLATLWSVNDESTAELITEFYQELAKGNLSKSEALRLAQIKILQNPAYSHPFFWSPFVLIGNWLS